jgi:CheY-like chemotaxis protein
MVPPYDTILVVEDDAATRELYRTALTVAGYHVIAVADGVDALRILEHEHPSAVILDLALPRLGGMDVYKELRAQPATRDIPVIIVTGTDARDVERNSVEHFIRKPVHPGRLIDVISSAIEHH